MFARRGRPGLIKIHSSAATWTTSSPAQIQRISTRQRPAINISTIEDRQAALAQFAKIARWKSVIRRRASSPLDERENCRAARQEQRVSRGLRHNGKGEVGPEITVPVTIQHFVNATAERLTPETLAK